MVLHSHGAAAAAASEPHARGPASAAGSHPGKASNRAMPVSAAVLAGAAAAAAAAAGSSDLPDLRHVRAVSAAGTATAPTVSTIGRRQADALILALAGWRSVCPYFYSRSSPLSQPKRPSAPLLAHGTAAPRRARAAVYTFQPIF